MFAILFTDKMDGFYAIITSFPTVIFTVLLIVAIFYWLVAIFGVVDFDVLDTGEMGDGGHGVNGIAGLAMRLGLNGVPLPIIITLIALIGWFICYYTVHFLYPFVPDIFELIVGAGVFVAAFYVSVMLTAQLIKPLRSFFKQADQQIEKTIAGRVAIVRTGRVDKKFGEATVEDGGAGLVVKVRSYKEEAFTRGDRVVLLEYDSSENSYKIISEAEFNE